MSSQLALAMFSGGAQLVLTWPWNVAVAAVSVAVAASS